MYTFIYFAGECAPFYMLGAKAKPGQLVLVRKSREFEVLSQTGFYGFAFSVAIDTLDQWFEQTGKLDLKKRIEHGDILFNLSHLEETKIKAIYTLAKKMADSHVPLFDERMLTEMFLSTIGAICTRSESHICADNNRERALIDGVLTYVRENSDTHIPVSNLSHHFGVSSRRLQLLFKSEIGFTTPKSYISGQRISLAHRMLKHMDPVNGGVSYVAGELGFSNFSKFSEVYCRIIGELPSETLKRPSFML